MQKKCQTSFLLCSIFVLVTLSIDLSAETDNGYVIQNSNVNYIPRDKEFSSRERITLADHHWIEWFDYSTGSTGRCEGPYSGPIDDCVKGRKLTIPLGGGRGD